MANKVIRYMPQNMGVDISQPGVQMNPEVMMNQAVTSPPMVPAQPPVKKGSTKKPKAKGGFPKGTSKAKAARPTK